MTPSEPASSARGLAGFGVAGGVASEVPSVHGSSLVGQRGDDVLRNPKLIATLTVVAAGLALAPAGFAQPSNDTPQTGSTTGSGRMAPGMMQGGGMSGTSGNPQEMMENWSKMMQGQSMPGMSDEMRRQMMERCRTMQRPSTGQSQPRATTPEKKE